MEADAIIVAILCVGQEIFHRLGCILWKEHHADVSCGCVEDCHLAVLVRVVKLCQTAFIRKGHFFGLSCRLLGGFLRLCLALLGLFSLLGLFGSRLLLRLFYYPSIRSVLSYSS